MIELNIARGDNARTFLGNAQRRFVLAVHYDAHTLQVEQNIDDVFLDTVDGGVFMQHTLDTAVDDRATAHRRQQNPS